MNEMKELLHRMAREALREEDRLEAAQPQGMLLPAARPDPQPAPAAQSASPEEGTREELLDWLDRALARRAAERRCP